MKQAIVMGFVRGVAPDTWAKRWAAVPSRKPLEIRPVKYDGDPFVEEVIAAHDILLVRVPENNFPAGKSDTRHTVALYTEKLALVVPKDHELATQKFVSEDDLTLIDEALLDYGASNSGTFFYDKRWPKPLAWAEPGFKPRNLKAALDLVQAGLGVTLAPQPLARALLNKKELKAVELVSDLPSATVFATWLISRDGNDIQELIGVLRGRGPNSSR